MEFLRRMDRKTIIILVALVIIFIPRLAWAQSDCVWENINCTATPTVTATPTGTLPATGTVEPIDFEAPEFPIPTSIPTLSFQPAPAPLEFTPIPAPSPLNFSLTPIPTPNFGTPAITISQVISLTEINSSINISHTTPLTLNLNVDITSTGAFSGPVGDVSGWMSGVISFTNYLTGEIANIQGSQTITVINAPDWYAPKLPRPMADVGWTFEQLTDPEGETKNFALSSWAGFFGYISTLPVQLVKATWQIVAYFGPFGLFLGWLLIMFVIVLVIHLQVFIFKFILTIIRLVVKLIELLGGLL